MLTYRWFEDEKFTAAWHQSEQALLGAFLANNLKCIARIDERLDAKHFYDPLNGEIFGEIKRRSLAGEIADPIALRPWFLALESVGDARETGIGRSLVDGTYLIKLLSAMVGIHNVADYCRTIMEGWARRELGRGLLDAHARAGDGNIPLPALALSVMDVLAEPVAITGAYQETLLGPALARALDRADSVRQGEVPMVYSTGELDLDVLLGGGYRRGRTMFLGGRPGHGKTSLAVKMAWEAAELHRLPVFVFSQEMSAEDIVDIALSQMSGVPRTSITDGSYSPAQAEMLVKANARYARLQVIIDDRPRLTTDQIRMAIRRLKRIHGAPLLVAIDHMHIMRLDPLMAKLGLSAGYGEIANEIKAISKEEQCFIIALAQLNRRVESAEEKEPVMPDYKNSGDIEAAGDICAFVYRPELYMLKGKPMRKAGESDSEYFDRESQHQAQLDAVAGKAIILTVKNRFTQPGALERRFDGPTTNFHPIMAG